MLWEPGYWLHLLLMLPPWAGFGIIDTVDGHSRVCAVWEVRLEEICYREKITQPLTCSLALLNVMKVSPFGSGICAWPRRDIFRRSGLAVSVQLTLPPFPQPNFTSKGI